MKPIEQIYADYYRIKKGFKWYQFKARKQHHEKLKAEMEKRGYNYTKNAR